MTEFHKEIFIKALSFGFLFILISVCLRLVLAICARIDQIAQKKRESCQIQDSKEVEKQSQLTPETEFPKEYSSIYEELHILLSDTHSNFFCILNRIFELIKKNDYKSNFLDNYLPEFLTFVKEHKENTYYGTMLKRFIGLFEDEKVRLENEEKMRKKVYFNVIDRILKIKGR